VAADRKRKPVGGLQLEQDRSGRAGDQVDAGMGETVRTARDGVQRGLRDGPLPIGDDDLA
jgi:hypothetical protein